MPTTKKTAKTTVAKKTANKSTIGSAATSSSLRAKVNSLEEQVGTLQQNLATLITVLEEEFRTHMLQGPQQVAAKIKSAGLLSKD